MASTAGFPYMTSAVTSASGKPPSTEILYCKGARWIEEHS